MSIQPASKYISDYLKITFTDPSTGIVRFVGFGTVINFTNEEVRQINRLDRNSVTVDTTGEGYTFQSFRPEPVCWEFQVEQWEEATAKKVELLRLSVEKRWKITATCDYFQNVNDATLKLEQVTEMLDPATVEYDRESYQVNKAGFGEKTATVTRFRLCKTVEPTYMPANPGPVITPIGGLIVITNGTPIPAGAETPIRTN